MDGDLVLRHQRFLRRLVRGLVRDEHAAEDVVQTTWLRALERPPQTESPPRAWLARVARNLVRNRRRDERPPAELAGQERAWPPADEVAERLELAARVVAAVHALPPPLSAVVLARYDEELALEEIARRSGVPLDTIKDRLKRAREELRRKLGRELGEERGTAGALVALVRRIGVAIGGGLAVKKGLALALVALLVVLGFRAMRGTAEDERTETGALASAELLAPPDEVVTPSADATLTRAPAPVVPATAPVVAEHGTLTLAISWPDGSPAEGVSGRIWPDEQGEFLRSYRSATTDASGRCTVEGLAPGSWRVQLDRQKDVEIAEVRANETTALVLEIRGDTRLQGIVVDPDGRPVAGAGVWISPRQPQYQGEPLDDWFAAHTRTDGRFSIPALGDAWIVGARAEGYAPSPKKPIRWMRSVEEVRLVLHGPGGAIEGRVLGPEGAPVQGAVVSGDIGFRSKDRFDPNGVLTGRTIHNMLPIRTVTGANGEFRFTGVQPGQVELSADSSAFGLTRVSIDVAAAQVARIELVFDATESVHGRVLAADGTPLSRIPVYARRFARDTPVHEDSPWLSKSWKSLFGEQPRDYERTYTAADGTYRFTCLQPGWTFVAAEHPDAGRAFRPHFVESGIDAIVDLHLDHGPELRCLLLDQNGAPLAGMPVVLAREAEGGGTSGSLGRFETDAAGLLVVRECQPATYQIDVRSRVDGGRIPGGIVRGLLAGPTEHRIVLTYVEIPRARVVGTVLDDLGRPLAGARISRIGEGGGRIAVTDDAGRFVSEEFGAGTCSFSIHSATHPTLSLPERDVPPDATLDLGTIQLVTPGFLDVVLRRADGEGIDDERISAMLYDSGGLLVPPAVHVELGRARSEPGLPGVYELRVEGDGLTGRCPVHVVAGATTELELVLEPLP